MEKNFEFKKGGRVDDKTKQKNPPAPGAVIGTGSDEIYKHQRHLPNSGESYARRVPGKS